MAADPIIVQPFFASGSGRFSVPMLRRNDDHG
jgi:hypothetical protein